jgi:two-component system sensor histidine kinase/response regulator
MKQMGEGYSVLIIDDSEDDVVLYRRLLKTGPRIGKIRCAATGAEGLASYQADPSDCILLDYHLPGEDGCDVMRQLRERDAYAAIIMLSGQDNEEVAGQALIGGASDYIVKDKISAAGLRRAVRNAVIKADLFRKLEVLQETNERLLLKLIHDLRAPLRHAASFASFLGEDLAEARYAELALYPTKIQGALQRANALIDTLFSYLQIEQRAELTPVSARTAADAAAAELDRMVQKRGARFDFGPLPSVLACPHRLVELFRQLFMNAITFNSSEAPTVSVEATRSDGGHWRISVKDNGPGIPPEKLSEIFHPLQRLCSHDKVEGTGLGLAICQKIVEAHGGRIWCESEADKGSVFHFTLPDASATAAGQASRSAA